MNTEEYYAPFLARILAVLGVVDLTSTGMVDIREVHDPVTAEVLEEAQRVA